MESITKQLFELGKGIIESKPEVTNPLYSAADDGGVENETGEFLYGLVRILKPKHIFETGTFTGISSMFMAQALKDNNIPDAEIFTCEISEYHKNRAEKLWQQVGVSQYIFCKLIESLKVEPARPDYDLLFLDSEPHLRFAELVKFFPYLKEGGYVLIHDLFGHLGQGGPINPDHPDIPNWPFGTLPEEIRFWLMHDQLRVMPIPAPRGLVLFYKTKEGDYKW